MYCTLYNVHHNEYTCVLLYTRLIYIQYIYVYLCTLDMKYIHVYSCIFYNIQCTMYVYTSYNNTYTYTHYSSQQHTTLWIIYGDIFDSRLISVSVSRFAGLDLTYLYPGSCLSVPWILLICTMHLPG